MSKMTRGEIAIAWIEKYLCIPEGKLVGQPFKLAEFQKDFLRQTYDNPAGTRTAILSMGRKNGKTALIAAIMLLHLVGPFAVRNSQTYSMAMTRDQAAILYDLMVKTISVSPKIEPFVKVTDYKKELSVPEIGTRYRALASDVAGKKSQGYSPVFFVADELGQVSGPASPLFDALFTGQGAHDKPLAIVISTQAASDSDLLSIMIDSAKDDPKTILSLHTAPKEGSIFTAKALNAANPALKAGFLNIEELKTLQEKAKAMPTFELEFRNKNLNQRVEKNTPFIGVSQWKKNGVTAAEDYRGKKVWVGLDLSSTRDLTAAAIVHENADGESYSVNMRFWLPDDGLADKARHDKVPYDTWKKAGVLSTTPGPTVDYAFVAHEVAKLKEECDIQKIAFDRWNWKHFRPELENEGLDRYWIDQVFHSFGQGFKSMSPSIRRLEELLLNGRFHHGNNPILTWNFQNIKVTYDPAQNRKFDKMARNRRIDGAVASVMAIGAATEAEVKDNSYLENEDMIFFS